MDTARTLAREEGLPMHRGGGKVIQSTKGALNEWAERRARAMSLDMAVPIEIQDDAEPLEAEA